MRLAGATALAVVLTTLAGGCAIQPDAAPREIPVNERGQLDPPPVAGESEGTNRVFMLTESDTQGGRMLRSVARDVQSTPMAVLEALILGPNPGETDTGIRTAVPSDLVLIEARPVARTLQVNVSSEILDLPGTALRDAVAQIVYTATELDGIDAVRLSVDGQRREWPDGNGQVQTDALTRYDFPGIAESGQPAYPAVPSEPPA